MSSATGSSRPPARPDRRSSFSRARLVTPCSDRMSGFFGSGKSHFLKVLSYVLSNRKLTAAGKTRQTVEFFESKIGDAMLYGDIKRAVAANTDVILFNIDSKADNRAGQDAILTVFLRVFNEMLGYSGDHPWIAH